MQQILRGKLRYAMARRKCALPSLAVFKAKHGLLLQTERCYHIPTMNPKSRQFLVSKTFSYTTHQRRGVAMLVARILKGALKIRYLVLGGTVGGGMALQKSYQEWKDSLPDMSWLESYLPSSEKIDSLRGSMIEFKDKVKDIEIDPRLKAIGEQKWNNLTSWLNTRIAEAYEAAERREAESMAQNNSTLFEFFQNVSKDVADEMTVKALPFRREEERSFSRVENPQQRIDTLQKELMEIQLKYQKELERLEKENKELKKQLLLARHNRTVSKTIKKSLIDMYSELLDELSDYDSSYDTQDHLPRVVVVGDQSAGKTSVLEMIAQARIFPRGAGEMMTRAPVKVTLSEGPYHVAQFKDSDREFDLTKEEDLVKLRTEVELRMKRSLRRGKTVSSEVISMTVKGPGLQRMVLVDLPGIISTVTVDMAEDTRESIKRMSQLHMSNPNAIILCVQDGSVDAERSNVTDLVSRTDPTGKRTIFVLTKVDLAEEGMTNPQRIQKILSGKLFPMKALGYFAVVTGRGKKDDTIEQIRDYEEQYFRSSRLFRENTLSSSQVTTRNLSLAVAQCFWKMVKETVEQQADAFKATRFNLEAEWKNSFPWTRELDRDELFEKVRGEILDEVVNLSQVSAKQWEALLHSKIWDRINEYVFEAIYLPAAQTGNPNSFNTRVDIRLREWAQSVLAATSISAGEEALRHEISQFLEKSNKKSDPLFLPVKTAVLDEALQRHSWETKGLEMLKTIQVIALEDRDVRDKQQWDSAIKFLEKSIKDKLDLTEKDLKGMLGPSMKEKWMYWQYSTEEQKKRNAIKSELEKILYSDYKHGPTLTADEMTAVRKNVSRALGSKEEVEGSLIDETWGPVYRRHFLKQSLARAYDCRKAYYLYHQGLESEIECNDVVLFWKLEQMLKVTSNALRQQVMNREARRLDKIIKDVLEEYGQNNDKKVELLVGRRVTLAEELKKVRRIQDRLEEFIQALNAEK